MSESKLNSNPEIILRKRRAADRIRLEKQELVKKRQENDIKLKRKNKNKFIRAENIVSKTLATDREKERIKRISKDIVKTNDIDNKNNFILKIKENIDNEIITEKLHYDNKPTLLFVIRVKGPNSANIPLKAFKILKVLRLIEINTGVFVKLTKDTFQLFKIISPYVIIGKPSLSSIRSIIQKRSRVIVDAPEKGTGETKEIILNDNNLIEEKLGNEGIICMEDIIHEIENLGESFNKCNFFLLPFKMNREISGFTALNKLNKIKVTEEDQEKRKKFLSNSKMAPIIEIDIDSIISKIN